MELYKISFPKHLTKKEYIGISCKGAKRRFTEHCSSNKQYPIVKAIKKYGKENAILTVLGEFSDYEEMYAAEKIAIDEHGTKSPKGYNLTDGGKGAFGLKASEERKRKISKANKGRVASEETRKKMSEANKGRDMSVQVAAMAKATRGRKRSASEIQATIDAWTGKRHSQESKNKMSISASKRRASRETREKMSEAIRIAKGDVLYSFINPDGQLVQTKNIKALCLDNNLSSTHMYNVHSKKAKSHKGWSLSTS